MESNNTTINDKIEYSRAIFGNNITQENKTAETEEINEIRTKDNDKSRTKETQNKRTAERKNTRNKESKRARLAVNIIMVDDTLMAFKTKAIKMGVKSWSLIDDAIQEYLLNYNAENKEVLKSRHQEVKKSGKKRHPANITLVEATKTAIWLLALKEKVNPWVLIEEALSLFLGHNKYTQNFKKSRI